MLAAISSSGQTYHMLANKTVDREIFELFVNALLEQLEQEHGVECRRLVFLVDNARIHKDWHILRLFK